MRVLGVALATLTTLMLAGCGSASVGGSGNGQSSSSGPDTAFYNGKTVTFIAPDAPGGSFDKWARLLAPAMGDYLHATVNVVNVPPGNTIVGQNQLAASAADGLTVGLINVPEDIDNQVTKTQGINFKLSSLGWVGSPSFGQMALVAQPSSPYKTFKDLMAAKTPIPMVSVTKGTAVLLEQVLFGAYGIKIHYVTGYESSKALAAGFLRGDAPLGFEELVVFQAAIASGAATPLWVSSAVPSQNPASSKMGSVPNLTEQMASSPPSTKQGKDAIKAVLSITRAGQPVAVPHGVPAGRLAALRAAMARAMGLDSVKQQALKESLNSQFINGQETTSSIQTDLSLAKSLKPYLTSLG